MDNSGFRSVVESFTDPFIGQNRCRIIGCLGDNGLSSGSLDCLKIEIFDSHEDFPIDVFCFAPGRARRIRQNAKTRTSSPQSLRVSDKDHNKRQRLKASIPWERHRTALRARFEGKAGYGLSPKFSRNTGRRKGGRWALLIGDVSRRRSLLGKGRGGEAPQRQKAKGRKAPAASGRNPRALAPSAFCGRMGR